MTTGEAGEERGTHGGLEVKETRTCPHVFFLLVCRRVKGMHARKLPSPARLGFYQDETDILASGAQVWCVETLSTCTCAGELFHGSTRGPFLGSFSFFLLVRGSFFCRRVESLLARRTCAFSCFCAPCSPLRASSVPTAFRTLRRRFLHLSPPPARHGGKHIPENIPLPQHTA